MHLYDQGMRKERKTSKASLFMIYVEWMAVRSYFPAGRNQNETDFFRVIVFLRNLRIRGKWD